MLMTSTEIVVAKSVVLVYGGHLIPWDIFAPIMKSFKTTDSTGVTILVLHNTFGMDRRACKYGMDFVGRLEHLRNRRATVREQPANPREPKDPELSFPYILVECIQSNATETRDKIYALRNLDPDYKTAPDPDLALSPLAVSQQNTVFALEHRSSFALIGLAGTANRRSELGVPSWVPDFSKIPELYPLDKGQAKYTAGGSTRAELRIRKDCKSSITIRGHVVDQIQLLDQSNPWKAHRHAPEFDQIFDQITSREWIEEAMFWPWTFLPQAKEYYRQARGKHHEQYVRGGSMENAFKRTAVGDDDNISFPASEGIVAGLDLMLQAYLVRIGELNEDDIPDEYAELSEHELTHMSQRILEPLTRRAMGRQFAVTKTGYFTLVPDSAVEGDSVVLFQGAKVPYLLRKVEGKVGANLFNLVGEAYVHGVMDGEYFSALETEDLSWIELV
jgi:hypothetical protein